MLTLHQLISTLKTNLSIDSVFLVGSRSSGTHNKFSDIDLVVIFKKNKNKLFSLVQFIEGRPAEIFFYDHETLKRLDKEKEVAANSMDAVLLDWLATAKIEFDKSGLTTAMKAKVVKLRKKVKVPRSEGDKWEALINHCYITDKRYFQSNDPAHLEALEVKMLYDVSYILTAYFEFRNIPWRGEKLMLKYLKEKDPSFHDLFMSCVRETTLSKKFAIYETLVKKVFCGGYKLWNKDIINPYIKGVLEPKEREKLAKYWKGIVGI